MRFASTLFFSLAVLALAPAAWAQERINLPQQAGTVEVPPESGLKLQGLRGELTSASLGAPPAAVRDALLEALPGDLRRPCGAILEHWGTVAQGTERWTVRILFRFEEEQNLHMLLSYRCGSSYSGYADYYDERLAALRLSPAGASLRLLPLADDCRNCSDLYHVGYSRSFPLAEGRLVELKVANSSDNPCCDGPEAWSAQRLLYLLLPETEPVLWLTTGSERWSHDDVDGDREEICSGTLTDTGVDEHLVDLTLYTVCRENDKITKQEMRTYRWNRDERRFEERAPTQP